MSDHLLIMPLNSTGWKIRGPTLNTVSIRHLLLTQLETISKIWRIIVPLQQLTIFQVAPTPQQQEQPAQFTTVKQVEASVTSSTSPVPPEEEEELFEAPASPPPVSNEPKTYANLLKSSGQATSQPPHQYIPTSYQKPSSPVSICLHTSI